MFRPVGSKVSFPELEERILGWWQKEGLFQQSVQTRQGKPRFVLYEGPPTANGSPGIHHVLARVFKDVIPRYKTMKGYYAPRIAGWDTHGLPVELEVERKLGLSSKTEIEEYGIDRFNALCRESVLGYLEEWNAMTERIGFWIDLEHPYVTMHNSYIESCWWAIKQMWGQGLVYQGYRVTPHCPRCGTSISSHEVALGYQEDTEDPSVYIKFKIDLSSLVGSEVRDRLFNLFMASEKPAYFLAWTTTPWTLPGNTALAVALDAEYSLIEVDGEYLILASSRLKYLGLENYPLIERLRGSDLVSGDGKEAIQYQPLYNPHQFGIDRRRFRLAPSGKTEHFHMGLPVQESDPDLTYGVIATDFVSMDDGTGIVHMAPAYGEVDFEAGRSSDLNFVHHVDLQGKITGHYPFSGRFVKEADPLIIEDLESRGLLFRSETVRHTYPFCWRCEAPLLYYAKQTWYIRTTTIKDKLISGNNEINWYPEHIKYGRFGDWLENNVDWAFSRERYWGTPLPVWQCEACGSFDCIGGVSELKEKEGFSGLREPLDLHRPFVDEVTYNCPKCGQVMRRVSDVIDCWFDSGAMPVAQLHYPFENRELFDEALNQADYICEAVDQTRGWFYSLHAISTLLFSHPCFRNVICLGHILDEKGEKMSKTRGNVVEPQAVIDKYGADALRWYCLTASPPGNVRRFSEKLVSELARRFLMTLWNVYSFFVIYANIDQFAPGADQPSGALSELDRWIISELNQLILDVDRALENYDPTEAGRKVENFVDYLSNWYVRRSRRRFWKSESDADKLAAYSTLYQCLVTLAQLMAPFTPFLAEELYQNLVRSVAPDTPQSVHLTDFPVADESKINQQLSADIRLAMKVASLGRATRSQAGIKVRQPLPVNYLSSASASHLKQLVSTLERIKPQILEELNIKDVVVVADFNGLDEESLVTNTEGDLSCALSTAIPAELRAEGMAREIVHRLQNMRRSAGFDIADHIRAYYQGGPYIKQVVADFADYIRQETLSTELIEGIPQEGVFTESYKLDGHEISLAVSRLA